jgi:hypothetical protein
MYVLFQKQNAYIYYSVLRTLFFRTFHYMNHVCLQFVMTRYVSLCHKFLLSFETRDQSKGQLIFTTVCFIRYLDFMKGKMEYEIF